MATVELRLPATPVTVTVVVPTAALAPAARLKVLVDDVLAGLNAAVTPAGSPETLRFTALLKPYVGATVMEAVSVPPGATLTAVTDDFRL